MSGMQVLRAWPNMNPCNSALIFLHLMDNLVIACRGVGHGGYLGKLHGEDSSGLPPGYFYQFLHDQE